MNEEINKVNIIFTFLIIQKRTNIFEFTYFRPGCSVSCKLEIIRTCLLNSFFFTSLRPSTNH